MRIIHVSSAQQCQRRDKLASCEGVHCICTGNMALMSMLWPMCRFHFCFVLNALNMLCLHILLDAGTWLMLLHADAGFECAEGNLSGGLAGGSCHTSSMPQQHGGPNTSSKAVPGVYPAWLGPACIR